MSKLPNGDKALVSIEKLTEYALNPQHPSGRHKARVFKAALGLALDDAAFLQQTVIEVARTHEALPQKGTAYGERYVIDFELATDSGAAMIRTFWIVRKGEDFPRLTSCYVLKGESDESV